MGSSQCYRKKPYPDEDTAIKAAHQLQIREDYLPKEGKLLQAYPCETCGSWHIGHSAIAFKESTTMLDGLKKEFLTERQGKQFVLYSGLVDLAHQRGLKRIRTEVLQFPSADNQHTAVCSAVVVMEGGQEYSGIGDANPANVGPAIAKHTIRMAETRAKARALRDALNIGVAALEELAEEETVQEQQRAAKPVQQAAKPAEEVEAEEKHIKQARDTFFKRCGELGHLFANTEQGKEEYRNFVAVLLGRPVSSLKTLTWEEWGIVLRNLNNSTQQKGNKVAA